MSMCKICFKDINKNHFSGLFRKKLNICQSCFNKFDVIFYKQKILNIPCLSLYSYNDYFRQLLFQFKGCYDIELKEIFLEKFLFELKLRYSGYTIIPVPSTKTDDENRGFNHVVEIFTLLNLPVKKVLYKKIDFKQSELHRNERKEIKNKLEIVNDKFLNNRKVLIVDDVITTGETLKASINLVKKLKPKKIKVLTLSYHLN